jgi:hypothetical protein
VIGESARPHDRPVEPASHHVILLTDVIRIRLAQEHPEHDVLPEEVQVFAAVSDPEARLADQAPHARRLHRADDGSGSL